MANKIIHKHSSVITDGKAKLPIESQLEYGELAVNYAAGVETISLKNSNNEIVEFKSSQALEDIIIKNELVTAHALTDLHERVKFIEDGGLDMGEDYVTKEEFEQTKTDISDTYISKAEYETDEEVIATVLTELDDQVKTISSTIEENELVTSAALTDLNKRLALVETTGGGGGGNADLTDYAKIDHSHGTITLSGDVTGSALISGTNGLNIVTTVGNNSHTHTSANITDSISASSGITSSASGLVQGKAVQAYAAPKTHSHGTITLSGDVTGSASISGTNAVNITATVANNSHTHTSSNISDSISTASNVNASATGLVQGKAVYEYAASKTEFENLISEIEDNEFVTAASLGDLNDRITTLQTEMEDNEYVVALAVTDLESHVAQLEQTVAALQEALANVTAQLANTLTI